MVKYLEGCDPINSVQSAIAIMRYEFAKDLAQPRIVLHDENFRSGSRAADLYE